MYVHICLSPLFLPVSARFFLSNLLILLLLFLLFLLLLLITNSSDKNGQNNAIMCNFHKEDHNNHNKI